MANNKKALSKNLILKRTSLPLKQMKYKLIYIVCQVFLKKIFPGDQLFNQGQQRHDGDPKQDARQLPQRDGGRGVMLVQFRDQIRSGDVQKAAGRHGKDIDQQITDMRAEREDQYRPGERRERGKQIVPKGFADGESAVHEDPEIADLLGDLVENDRQGRGEADGGAHHKARSDDHAV